jgi:GPH family glycoside/pentoside/hexuronide:cation symporter
VAAPAPSEEKLSASQLGWYGLGAVPHGVGITVGTFLVFYYNQVLGVPGASVGLAILVGSIFDAVTDPIVGAISDRTHSRWGRRHPYLFCSSIPLGIGFYFLWVPPSGLGESGLVAWLVAMLVINKLLSTIYFVPYLAFGAELSGDYLERTRVTTARSVVMNIGRSATGAALLLYFLRPTELFPNGQLNPEGYPPFAISFGIVIAMSLMLMAYKTRFDGRRLGGAGSKVGDLSAGSVFMAPLRDMRDALRYRPFRALTFAVVLSYTAFGVSDALGLYMITFFWGFPTHFLFVWGVGMSTGMYLGFWLWQTVGKHVEKRTVYLIASIGYLLFFPGPYVLAAIGWWPAPESALYVPLYIGTTGVIAHVFAAGPSIMTGSMLGDITDLDELETGKRREGVLFGAESLAYKMVSGVGPFIAGLLIDLANITPEMQPGEAPEHTIKMLGLGQGATSAALFVAAIFLIARYDLTRERHDRTLRALAERRRSA